MVTFVDETNLSEVEQQWTQDDGSLLEFAESHGLTPAYGCRSGLCGACKVTLTSGSVTHRLENSSFLNSDEVLLCCARPAFNKDETLPLVKLKI